ATAEVEATVAATSINAPSQPPALRITSGLLVFSRPGELSEELLDHDPRRELGRTLQVQVRLEQHSRELVDPPRSQVGMLLARLVDGGGEDVGLAAGVLEAHPG